MYTCISIFQPLANKIDIKIKDIKIPNTNLTLILAYPPGYFEKKKYYGLIVPCSLGTLLYQF